MSKYDRAYYLRTKEIFKSKINTFCIDCGKRLSAKHCKRCISCSKLFQFTIPNNNPNFLNGKPKCADCGKELKFYSRKRCLFCSKQGKNNPNWCGGCDDNDYPWYFNNQLKLKIRTRDNFKCQCCGIKEKNNRNLDVHHIDYNKENCKEDNLITVCFKCNIKANFNRDYWYAYYSYIIKENIYG